MRHKETWGLCLLVIADALSTYWLITQGYATEFNPLKYPLLLVLAYLAVQGGALMALGFVMGIVLPLAVITGLAVREAVARGDER